MAGNRTIARWNEPVRHPCAWRGDDVRATGDYALTLDDEEIADIDRVLGGLGDRVAAWETLRRRDFPFEALATRLERVVEELDRGRGFVLLRGIPVERYSPDQCKAIYWGLGTHLGVEVVRQSAQGELIGDIVDLGLTYGPDVRGYKTTAALRPHADPTDYVGLFCIGQAKRGGESTIASSMAVFNEMLATAPELLAPLFRGFHTNLRGEADHVAAVTPARTPAYSVSDGILSCNVNPRTVVTAPAKTGIPLTELELEAVRTFAELAARPDLRLDMDLRPGDVQFVNNYVTLHARSEYVDDPAAGFKRHLYRLWLNTHRRPLHPDVAWRRDPFMRGDAVSTLE